MATSSSQRVAGRLAGLAGADLIWRVPFFTPGDGAGVDIFIALVGFALNFGSIGFLSELSTWILLGYIGALLTPRAYPSKLQLPTEKLGFRGIFSVGTVSIALLIRRGSESGNPLLWAGVIGLSTLIGGVLLSYLSGARGWKLSPADNRFLTLIDAIFPGSSVERELQDDFARSGVLGVLGVTFAWTAAGMVLCLPVFLSGAVAVVLILLYPLPDVLVVAWAGLSVIGSVTGWSVSPSMGTVDVETQLYDLIKEATRSVKGMILGIYLTTMTFGFGSLFALALGLVSATSLSSLTLRQLWGVSGIVVVLASAVCYGLWCCFRMSRRLPVHLQQYNGHNESQTQQSQYRGNSDNKSAAPLSRQRRGNRRHTVAPHHPRRHALNPTDTYPKLAESAWDRVAGQSSSAESTTGRNPPSRPIGFVGLPFGATILVSVSFIWFGPTSTEFGLLWPLLLGSLLGCAVLSTQRENPVQNDDHYIIAGTVGLVLTGQILGSLETILTVLETGSVSVTALPTSGYMAIIVVWLGYLDDVFQYSEAHDDIRRIAKGGYLLAFSVALGVLFSFTSGAYRGLFTLLLCSSAIGGLALVLTSWFRL